MHVNTPSNRTRISKLACQWCRAQHRKCDGQSPCSNCKKRGQECIFIARKKRESNKRKITHLENMNQKKQRLENVFRDVRLYLSTVLMTFVEMDANYHPVISKEEFIDKIPSLVDLMASAGINVTSYGNETGTMFMFYAALAVSTRQLGDVVHANEFHNRARLLAGQLFDSAEFVVGCGFCLMAFSAYYLGDEYKSLSYVQVAKRICETLNLMDSDLYKRSIMAQAMLESTYEQRVQLYTELGRGGKFHVKIDELISLVGLADTHIRMKRNPNFLEILALLEKSQKMLKSEEVPNIQIVHDVRVFIMGCMAIALHKRGYHKQALEWANQVTKVVSGRVCPHALIRSIEAAASVHLLQGQVDAFEQDLFVLGGYAGFYPIAKQLHEKLSKQLTPVTQKTTIQSSTLDVSISMSGGVNTKSPQNSPLQVTTTVQQVENITKSFEEALEAISSSDEDLDFLEKAIPLF